MTRVIPALLLVGVSAAAQMIDRTGPPAAAPPRPYKLPPVTETKLPNGLTIVAAEDDRLPLVTVRLVFLTGNKRDPKDLPGLAAAVGDMLIEGTTASTAEQIAQELDAMGGVMTANSGADSLSINASVLAENTPQMLELAADVARNSLVPEHELDLQKQNRRQNLQLQYSQPAFLANLAFRQAVFGDGPYAHIGPTTQSVQRLERSDITAFRDTYLVPNNAFLILVGKLPARSELMKMITENFGAWQRKDVPAYHPSAAPDSKRKLLLVDRPGSVQADMRIGRSAGSYGDPLLFPILAAGMIEGGGPNSRLFLDIREKRGFAYDVHTEYSRLADAGTFSTVTEVRNEVVADALPAILSQLDLLAKEPVEMQELAEAKAYASGAFVLSMEPQQGLADNLLLIKVMNLPKDYLETYTTRFNSVRPDQILQAARNYIAPANDVIVVVGDAVKLKPALAKFGQFEMAAPAQ